MINAHLSCGCWKSIKPPLEAGKKVHCRNHARDLQDIVTLQMDPWKVRCDTCRYSATFGEDKTGAHRAAHKHNAQNATHWAKAARVVPLKPVPPLDF